MIGTRVLIAYASKNGSTEEIARRIADELEHDGLSVDCLEAGSVRNLGEYGAVILGSAVYAKRWRRSARGFLRRHQRALSRLPWWVFSSGPVGEPKAVDARMAGWLESPKTISKAERLGARTHVVFGGRIPSRPHNFVERAMAKNTPAEFADRRNWEEIKGWARGIAAQLSSGNQAPAAP